MLDDHFPPNTFRMQPPDQKDENNFSDGSGALFSMYLDRAEEEDKKMADGWKGDADGILVFVSPNLTSHISV
jgi:hypothetical protein